MGRGFFVLEKAGIPHSENLYFPKYQNTDFQGGKSHFSENKNSPSPLLIGIALRGFTKSVRGRFKGKHGAACFNKTSNNCRVKHFWSVFY